MNNSIFEATGKSLNKTKLRTKVRNFVVDVDEPKAMGGGDEAPNPVEYILIGLAGCINVVAHHIAGELDITINNLEIKTSGDINSDKFLGTSDKERAGFQGINLELSYQSDAPQESIDKWLEGISKRCPVKDNLLAETPVTISVKAA
ncbi:MAG: OsmC family protein [Bacteroidales bacterium]|jgi:uncharacterized OsmC-like protein|nr:OsmC family protein [Bacteroidales bacterium]